MAKKAPMLCAESYREQWTVKVGVFRTGPDLKAALDKIQEIKQRLPDIKVKDRGRIYNTDLLSALEVDNLLDLAEIIVAGALARTESRGGSLTARFSPAGRCQLAQAYPGLLHT